MISFNWGDVLAGICMLALGIASIVYMFKGVYVFAFLSSVLIAFAGGNYLRTNAIKK